MLKAELGAAEVDPHLKKKMYFQWLIIYEKLMIHFGINILKIVVVSVLT